jgi:hypothetical protein
MLVTNLRTQGMIKNKITQMIIKVKIRTKVD